MTDLTVSRLAPRWQALKALVPTAVMFGLLYFCGLVFYQANMSAWGFDASLFPINTQEVYTQGFVALLTIGGAGLALFARFIGWVIGIICAMLVLDIARRWHRRTILMRRRQQQQKPSSKTAFWFLKRFPLFNAGYLGLVGVLLLSIALLMVLALGQTLTNLARTNAQRDWDNHTFLSWSKITWADDDGGEKTGHLKVCSDKWCALIQDGQSRQISLGQVRRIEQTPPISAGRFR